MSSYIKDLLNNENNFKLISDSTGNRIKILMDNKYSFKLVHPKTGKDVDVTVEKTIAVFDNPNANKILMNPDASFKLINPRTGEAEKLLMDPEESFKLVRNNNKNSFRLLGSENKEKYNTEETVVKKKKRSKLGTLFLDSSFSLLEMLITIIFIMIASMVVVKYSKKSKCDDENKKDKESTYEVLQDPRLVEFIDLYTNIVNNYYDKIDTNELLDTITESMLKYLGDTYSGYLNEYDARNLSDRLKGEYQGIGIEISTRVEDKAIIITDILKDSPADKSGLKIGDRIISINEISMEGKNSGDVSILIKDKLTGVISLKITRDDKELTFNVNKGKVVIESVKYEMFDRTGYIKIETFSNNTYEQVSKAIKELENNNMNSLVIDVRDNNGGFLNAAYNTADIFIEKDKVIYKLESNKGKATYKAKEDSPRYYPIAVIINGGSASASEVFALAMKDSYGATLVGTKSYGKSSVQETSKLSTGSLVKYTIATWLGPNDENIGFKGITPDIKVSLKSSYNDNPTYENDNVLKRAIKAVK